MTSLTELLVAAAVTSSVMGGVLAAIMPAHATLLAQSNTQDASQRLRVAFEVLRRDLLAATLVSPAMDGHPIGQALAIRRGTERHSYYFEAAASQLRHVDPGGSDFPVLDDISHVAVEFIGDAGPIASAALTDGPWLPSAEDPDRFDADLLALRLVRVHVTASARFAGTVRATFDVAPRNMNAAP
jgi:hypothetical protein